MLRAALLAVLLATGCRHDIDRGAENPKPVGVVPLPPASGTPIGYLVDNASQMKLSDEQFMDMIQKNADRFQFTRIRRGDSDGRLIRPGWPGVKLKAAAPA